MSAIPSYGGVSIGMTPSASGYGYGATPPSALYPPVLSPMMRTLSASGMGSGVLA
ncbi:hypothetical protein PI125_g11959 [Phytophthora idaei]|nr:hypothetical protein PI125_g11959 [Phytophthora idaei]